LPWDIETAGGLRIECKDSILHRGLWAVNTANVSHKRRKAQWYVFCLRGLEGHRGIAQRLFVVLSARQIGKKKMYRWTLRALLHKHAANIGNWERIIRAERRRLKCQGA
jgi:hypothetical protein